VQTYNAKQTKKNIILKSEEKSNVDNATKQN
jgi:hypothetical protein